MSNDSESGGRRSLDGDLLPPWLAFPNLPRFSIAWRRGLAESHLTSWTDWYLGLSERDRRVYRKQYRAPWPLWTGSYLALSRNGPAFTFGLLMTAIVFISLVSIRFALFPWVRGIKVD